MINDYHQVQIIYLLINVGHLNNEIFIGSWSVARDSFLYLYNKSASRVSLRTENHSEPRTSHK